MQYGRQAEQGAGRSSSPKLLQHALVAERTGGRLGFLDLANFSGRLEPGIGAIYLLGCVHVAMVALAELGRFCRWVRL